MAVDSASPIHGLRLQGSGNNINTWGSLLNDGGLKLLEQAGDGVETITVTGSLTLTATNFVENQSRQRVLRLIGTPPGGFSVIVPNREKLWLIVNATGQTATIRTASGGAVAIAAGDTAAVYCDAVDCALADNVTRSWVRSELMTAALSAQIPNQAGNAGRALITDGSQVAWSTVALNGGAASISATADLSLTASSARVQSLAFAQPYRSVILPDATGLMPGGPIFVLGNGGTQGIAIRDIAGTMLKHLPSGATVLVHLIDNQTAAGRWLIVGDQAVGVGAAGPATLFESSTVASLTMVRLSDSKALVAYQDGESGMRGTAVAIEDSAGAAIVGTPTVFHTANAFYIAAARIADNAALLVFRDNVAGSFVATGRVMKVAGTTLTPGTSATFDGTAAHLAVAALGGGKAIAAYQDLGNSGLGTACLLTVSDTAIAAGSPATFAATATEIRLAALDATRVLCSYTEGSSRKAVVLTESAGSVSAGTPVIDTVGGAGMMVLTVSTDRGLLLSKHAGTNRLRARTLAVSATALSIGPAVDLPQFAGTYALHDAVATGQGDAVVLGYADLRLAVGRLAIDGAGVALREDAAVAFEQLSAVPAVITRLRGGRYVLAHGAPATASAAGLASIIEIED